MAQSLRKAATVFGTAALTTALVSSPVYAEGEAKSNKKSIYDNEERQPSTINLEHQPTRLISLMGEIREETLRYFKLVKSHGQILVDKWIDTERSIEGVVKRTIPEGEKLAPGIIYVGISMLAGPIFTRRRNFFIRWSSPLIFGTLSAFYFLPGTSNVVLRNVWGRYGDPKTIDGVCEQWKSLKKSQQDLKQKLADNIQELRLSLQEGRSFTTPASAPAVEDVKVAAEKVAESAAAPVAEKVADASSAVQEKKEEVVAGVAEVAEKAKEAVAAAAAAPAPKTEPKPKSELPLGFKNSTD